MATVIYCPSCNQSLQAPDELLGQTVQCPKCQSQFVATDTGVASAAPPATSHEGLTERPEDFARTSPPPDDYYEDDEAYDRRSRRRRRSHHSEEAASKVAAPAICMMVIGGLALALSVLGLIANIAMLGMAADNPRIMRRQGDFAIRGISGIGGAILGLVWGGLVLNGAMQMKKLRSYGWAMTSCIIAMIPCNICCLFGLPVGIWALVVLNDEEVKSAFR